MNWQLNIRLDKDIEKQKHKKERDKNENTKKQNDKG